MSAIQAPETAVAPPSPLLGRGRTLPSIICRATEPDAAGVVALIRQVAIMSPCGEIREIREFASGWSPTPCRPCVIYAQLTARDVSYATGQIYSVAGGFGLS